jgi:metallopeptidase MepB
MAAPTHQNLAALQPPLRFDATPESLLKAAEERLQHATEVVEAILAKINPSNATFANSILPLIEAENERIYNDPPISFYMRASAFEEIRNASRQAEKLISNGLQDLFARQELYNLVIVVLKSPEELESESEIYLLKLRYFLIERGFSIPIGSRRDRYHSIRKQIDDLKMEIQKNVNENNEGVWLTRDDLTGVSEDVISRLSTRDSGEFWLKFNSSAFLSVRNQASKASVRKDIVLKDASRNPENAGLVRELFLLRDEAARLLGYRSDASFRLEPNLISTPEEVTEFLVEFQRRFAPHRLHFMQKLIDAKKKYMANNLSESWDDCQKIFLWDQSFYRRLVQQAEYQYDEEKVKQYFTVEHTIPKMLGMLGSYFQVLFEPVDTSSETSLTWHEDVMMYRVWHANPKADSSTTASPDRSMSQNGDGFMGYFYYDLYERPGKPQQCTAYSIQKVGDISAIPMSV